MKVKKIGWFLNLILPKSVIGICLAPFGIYLRESALNNQHTIDHETTHWKQQMEMLIIFFYLWYVAEWFIKLLTWGEYAYWNLSFEREARYIADTGRERKRFGWIDFI